jgi:hypothetical protein
MADRTRRNVKLHYLACLVPTRAVATTTVVPLIMSVKFLSETNIPATEELRN